jgi:drug/metabolite transporter (DMT)-like permease
MVSIHEILLPLSGAVILAVQALLLRMATRQGKVSDVLLIVLCVNTVLIIPIAAILSYPNYGLTGLSVVAFVGAGLIGTVLGRLAYFIGIQRVGASRAESLKASTPFFATIIAIMILGELTTGRHLLGVILIVFGIAIISWDQAKGPNSEEGSVKDLLFPLLAALLYAIEPIFAKIGLNEGTPFFVGLAIKTLAATLGFLGYLWWHHDLPTSSDLSDNRLPWYIASGLANTVFIAAFYASLSVAPVVLVVPIIQASPLFVVVLSYLFLQNIERVTRRLAIGALVVIAGGILVAVYG